MPMHLRYQFLGLSLAAALFLPPASAEESAPAACPDNAEKVLIQNLAPLQNGQTDGLNQAYANANAVRTRCADNSLATGLSVNILAQIAILLSQSGSTDASNVWREAYIAAIEQDSAPAHADLTLSWENGTGITLTDADMRTTVDAIMETDIAPAIAAFAMQRSSFGSVLTNDLTVCPYPSANQSRAVREAKGLADGVAQDASSYSEPGAVLTRLDNLRKACTAQAPALTEQTVRAYVEFADALDEDLTAPLASCMADDAIARIAEYRDMVGDAADAPTRAVLTKMATWEKRLKTHHVIACKR
jgi:hypothetical protein